VRPRAPSARCLLAARPMPTTRPMLLQCRSRLSGFRCARHRPAGGQPDGPSRAPRSALRRGSMALSRAASFAEILRAIGSRCPSDAQPWTPLVSATRQTGGCCRAGGSQNGCPRAELDRGRAVSKPGRHCEGNYADRPTNREVGRNGGCPSRPGRTARADARGERLVRPPPLGYGAPPKQSSATCVQARRGGLFPRGE